jgi:dolichyl-phosphate beta-glucosyltransferase
LKVIKSPQNGGKGLAVKIGMLSSAGEYLLFADADNATKAQCIEDLIKSIDKRKERGLAIAIGSRNHAKKDVVKQRDGFRNFLSLTANTFLKCIFSTTINVNNTQDTQCGFKMFTRKAARDIFRIQHIERWAFDLEIIYLSSRYLPTSLQIPIEEVPVHWVEIPGSKFSVIRDLINMFRDALLVRILYTLGIWTVDDAIMY